MEEVLGNLEKNKILNGVLVPMTAEEEVVFDADKLIAHAEIAAMQAKAVTEAEKKASAITPVPGGVGPMTIACLLRNTTIAYKNSKI